MDKKENKADRLLKTLRALLMITWGIFTLGLMMLDFVRGLLVGLFILPLVLLLKFILDFLIK